MCIVLLTTAHPDYALIVIDNRDEFILRPTSRPSWWSPTPADAAAQATGTNTPGAGTPRTPQPEEAVGKTAPSPTEIPTTPPLQQQKPQHILSSRDLQRPEHGTWLGVTRAGHIAVLTNFREDVTDETAHLVHGARSRGGMVTAWLGANHAETTPQFVERMLAGPGVHGVGGFSLICGKLRRRRCRRQQQQQQRTRSTRPPGTTAAAATTHGIAPLAIVSNRADKLAEIPWIAGHRGAVYGLSNARFDDPEVWPKVRDGVEALRALVTQQADKEEREDITGTHRTPSKHDEDALRDALFAILDRDTLPLRPGLSFEEQIPLLKHSIFIPAIGDEAHRAAMARAMAAAAPAAAATCAKPGVPQTNGTANNTRDSNGHQDAADVELAYEERPEDQQAKGFMTGLYGTQRQTVILVDWNGRVSFTERALWDAHGHAIPRGAGDVHVEFQIEGWDEEEDDGDDDVVDEHGNGTERKWAPDVRENGVKA
ncbi:DUF833 domain containing protein [Niveomyces insectorum RCEF 264]|uniref:DUF833 domain containing protein n=1 Tax=Niveomyces insectorum RCEF 264 TaxID=1081102 RepID=A0A162K610_9HYPO|nr:DUF833 domain containing protein [Niveomyces insectorum RCEF 264]